MAAVAQYDLIVIGSGPGGIAAAVRAAELGMKTACIEKDSNPGGVCLNVGCIPSKALLDSSEYYHLAKEGLVEHGVRPEGVSLDISQMMERKRKIVAGLGENVRSLFRDKKVDLIGGTALLTGENEVEVGDSEGGEAAVRGLRAEFILLAMGSEPVAIPGIPFDGSTVISSTEALSLDAVPGRLGIIGAGYIGLELGCVWARLGSEVTVFEMLPRICPGLDGQVARLLERSLARRGLRFKLGTRVDGAETGPDGVKLSYFAGETKEEAAFDKLLVAVGRKPLTRGAGIEELGIELEAGSGRVVVDTEYRTSVASIYAIGDLISGPMLAHKAAAEGRAAIECMAGLPGEVNYDAIPSVVYTSPEAASVGLTEEEVRARGVEFRAAVYPFSATARARSLGETDGLAKILAQSGTGRILGIHLIGPRVSEMISLCAGVIELNATVKSLRRIVFPHPTLSEAIGEAAALLAIHFP